MLNKKLPMCIQDRWDWTIRYPVIRFSFGGGIVQSPENLSRKIWEQLRINLLALGF